MGELAVAAASALWLGILTSISPCPLATNIAAVSYLGRRVDRPGQVLGGGLLYSLGRTIAYVALGALIVAARGAQLAERLIQQDGVQFMLGPYSSGLTKAIAPVTEKFKVPMVEGNGASRSLFNKGYKYLFAVLSTSEQYLQEAINLAAQTAESQGRSASSVKVAVAVENDPFSLDIRAGILDDAKRHGMKVVVDDKLPRELSDMSATLTKVKALKPDVLVVSGHSKGGRIIESDSSRQNLVRYLGEVGLGLVDDSA